ncbi:DUF4350 domain-containing protein [Tautonia plasticadhaerens]|uniref:DUF4350 domain-containing protein n=1 Tax=Tautonia plasticadhaerens TaxID=2527974 RepID=A0A518H038_9BACT|nr:DUF4350 domain-containing protein [Tautonia plasticadhaerens]QDV34199.1 hypothetical protein ElP_20840 [Tautonia plasticadhaerens]
MTGPRIRIRGMTSVALAVVASLSGCGGTEIDTTYGLTRGESVNGTGVFAELLRHRGHEVRTARRLNDELGDWAETLVRFAPYSGPIEREEAEWYLDWQLSRPGRRLIYVCRDGGAEAEYWSAALASLPADAPQAQRERIEARLADAGGWGSQPAPPGTEPADPETWFGLDTTGGMTPACSSLEGPWAEGVDPASAAIPVNRALDSVGEAEAPLLVGDGRILAMDWTWEMEAGGDDRSAVLVLANGAFLLNAAMVPPGRRPLAVRAAGWAGEEPRNVAFVEGSFLLGEETPMPTPWDVIRQIPALGVVAGHFLALALAAALSRAVILGRPRPAPSSGADRPRAHAEALGDLMARVGGDRAARAILASYRRWRRPGATPDAPPGGGESPP